MVTLVIWLLLPLQFELFQNVPPPNDVVAKLIVNVPVGFLGPFASWLCSAIAGEQTLVPTENEEVVKTSRVG